MGRIIVNARVRDAPSDSEPAQDPHPSAASALLAPGGKVVLQIGAEFITETIQRSQQLIIY